MSAVDLICIDVDGTLLDSSGAIPPEALQEVERLRKRGIRFALCSGRPAFGITLEYAQQLDPEGWHIFQNGASVVRPATGESASSAIDPEIIAKLIERANKKNRLLELYGDREYAVERDADRTRRHAQLLGIPFRTRPFSSLQPPIVRAQWLIPHEELSGIEAENHDGLNLCPSHAPLMPDTTFVNMTADGVHKGTALKTVAAAYGTPLSRVMMIGDGKNDVGAMRIAGVAIAMGNADSSAIEVAHQIVGHVDEDGLLEALAFADSSNTVAKPSR